MGQRFRQLFEPIDLGPIKLKNRVAVATVHNMLQDFNGCVGMDTLCYYTRRVRGGFGLIMSEPLSSGTFQERGGPYFHSNFYDPKHALGWMRVTEAIHAFGGRIIAQIAGGGMGRQVFGPGTETLQPAAASPIPLIIDPKYLATNLDKSPEIMSSLKGPLPREIEESEIWAVIEGYSNITKLAIKAGFDGVVLHSCHGYFGHNFLSPNQNRRTDDFGGSFENRTRYLRESFKRMMQAIKDEKADGRFVAGVRTSAAEHTPNGFTYEDAVRFHQMLIDFGASFADFSDGAGYERFNYLLPSEDMMSVKVEQAKFFDKHLNVPILIPSIHDPDIAAQVAKETKNVIISLGRQSLADPDWPNKVKEGRIQDVVRCQRCNTGCILGGIVQGLPLRCVVNPEQGRERYDTANWPKPKGPSGKGLR